VRVAYFDTSALIKLFVHEPESLELVRYLETPLEAATSALTVAELERALRRRGVSAADIEHALDGFFVIDLPSVRLREAARLEPPTLRTLDAIHLACALSIGENALHVVAYDERLATAARRHGLTVVQPGWTNELPA
jgi:uncharacterized protein